MSVNDDKSLEVRCFCRRAPLLAMCGRDSRTGKPFVHIKSARKDRINAEAVVTSGEVSVRCRDCLRWHTIRIKLVDIHHKAESLPDSIRLD